MKYNIVKQDDSIYVTFESRVYIIDNEQISILKGKYYNFDISVSDYHYYCYNNQIITLLEHLNNFRQKNIIIKFKNGNRFDIRRSNIIIQHYKYNEIDTDYEIINYIPGHIITKGVETGYMKNPIWEVKNNNENILLMYCETNTLVTLCKKSLEIIKDFEKKYNIQLTFHSCGNGYVGSHFGSKYLYMHQIIMNLYGQGKGTMNESVDHINKDVTDNRYINLRIGDRKVQENNKERTGRKKSKLPEGFIPENFPKYFEYNCEKLPSGTIREFFRIPKRNTPLEKNWTSSKSVKISILEKYRDGLNKYKQVFGELPSDITYPDNFIL